MHAIAYHESCRPFLLLLWIATGLMHSQPSVAGQAEAGGPAAANGRTRVYVLVTPLQDDLLGPDPRAGTNTWGYGNVNGFFKTMSDFGLSVFVDSAVSYVYSQSEAAEISRTVDDQAEEFDFDAAIDTGISSLANSLEWDIVELQRFNEDYSKARLAKSLLETDADRVAYLEFLYFISPGMDQVRLVGWLELHSPPGESKRDPITTKRRFEYLSPSQGLVLRPFRPGEKQAMIDSVEKYYAEKTERFPNNRKAYEKDRRNALHMLQGRDLIPPLNAMTEGWPGTSLHLALQEATDRVFELMAADLAAGLTFDTKNAARMEVTVLNMTGRPATMPAYLTGSQGANNLYRDARGNLYSLPTAPETL